MYSGVPKIMPVLVSFRPGSPSVSMSLILAMPKSTIFTKSGSPPRLVRKMFSGFMSRWTMPLSWAAPSAWQHWMRMWSDRSMGTVPSRASTFARSSPSRNSMTK